MAVDVPHPRPSSLEVGARFRAPATKVAVVVAAIVVLSALQALRQAGARSWNTVWAEDGTVYLAQGNHLRSIFETYAGYLQLLPRLIGFGANHLPIDQVSRYFTVTSAVVTSFCAIVIYRLSRPLVPSVWLRGLLALSTVLIPGVLAENLNSPTNLVWVLLFAAWWALLVAPTSRSHAVLAAVVVALSALSSVLTLLYFPVAALLGWKRRTLDQRIVLGAYLLAAAVQFAFVLTADDPEAHHVTRPGDLAPIYGVRVLAAGVFGDRMLRTAWIDHGYVVAWCAGITVLGVVVLLLLRNTGVHLCLGVLSVVYSAGIYAFVVARRGSADFALSAHQWSTNGGRFVALSLWLLLSGIVLLVSGARVSVTVKRVMIGVLVVHFAVTAAADYRAINTRSDGPVWQDEIAAARVACGNQAPSSVVSIPITPPSWEIELSCARIMR